MKRLTALVIGALWVGAALAQQSQFTVDNRKEDDFIIQNFHFQSGETLPELRIHYVTLGTPRRDPSGRITNAVVLLHGTAQSGQLFLASTPFGTNIGTTFFGKDQPLDSERYYVIIPDAIGHGRSSKPSDGLRAKFPHYGYNDIVEAEHRAIIEALGVDHVRLVSGLSMGGMHSWLWGEKYPDFMDGLLPIASQPVRIVGRNYLWRRLITEAIRNDTDWQDGNYEKQPTRWRAVLPILQIMLSSPTQTQSRASTQEASDALFNSWVAFGKVVDANDFLYAWASSWDYDPAPSLSMIKAKLLAVNFADDLANSVEIGAMEFALSKIANSRSVTIARTDQSLGHWNYFFPEIWKPYVIELLKPQP